MNITRENVDHLNATLKVQVVKEDYETRVEAVLKDYRKKARIDGFRPGKIPPGLIRKMYWKSVLIEEMNKLVSESLSRYIADEKLNILGEPLPGEKEQQVIDWDKQTEFEFAFDLGLAPEFDISLSKKDKVPYYTISIDKKMIESYKEDYTRRYGSFKTVERASDREILKGRIQQLGVEGTVVTSGINVEETSVSIEMIQDPEIKNRFTGTRAGDVIDFNIRQAFPNDTEISSILGIDKKQLASIGPDFRFTIQDIRRFEPAEINQEFFDKAFGTGAVHSAEEFHAKAEEEIGKSLARESDYRFAIDAKERITGKLKIELPSGFLKRWLFSVNEEKVTMDQIEKDFDHFEKDLKWQLIKERIIRDNAITVTEEEALEHAKQVALMQFRQYGMANLPEDYLINYAKDMLTRKEEGKKIYERKYEDKVIEFIRERVKLDQKKVTSDEFNALYDTG